MLARATIQWRHCDGTVAQIKIFLDVQMLSSVRRSYRTVAQAWSSGRASAALPGAVLTRVFCCAHFKLSVFTLAFLSRPGAPRNGQPGALQAADGRVLGAATTRQVRRAMGYAYTVTGMQLLATATYVLW